MAWLLTTLAVLGTGMALAQDKAAKKDKKKFENQERVNKAAEGMNRNKGKPGSVEQINHLHGDDKNNFLQSASRKVKYE